MPQTAEIDMAAGEAPRIGEKFLISLQENGEMLGLLDEGRTFLFVSPGQAERDYQEGSRALTVVGFDLRPAGIHEQRVHGALSYAAE